MFCLVVSRGNYDSNTHSEIKKRLRLTIFIKFTSDRIHSLMMVVAVDLRKPNTYEQISMICQIMVQSRLPPPVNPVSFFLFHSNPAIAANSNTLCRFSWVLAEHSTKLVAPILLATFAVLKLFTGS